jgi:hypothetical protein
MGVTEWGMLGMYNDSVCASYTTIQRLYHQNRYDGDGYLIPPQDLDWVEYVLHEEAIKVNSNFNLQTSITCTNTKVPVVGDFGSLFPTQFSKLS